MCLSSKPKTVKAVTPAAAPPAPEAAAERVVTDEQVNGSKKKKNSALNALRIDMAPKTGAAGAGLNVPQ